jgi:hypothetical protein
MGAEKKPDAVQKLGERIELERRSIVERWGSERTARF